MTDATRPVDSAATATPGGANHRQLGIALALILVYMLILVVGGVLAGSIALIANAGHMLADAAALALALFAVRFANRPASVNRTFGYRRVEVLAAMLNALVLWLIAAGVAYEAYERFLGDDHQHVEGELMLVVGGAGFVINMVAIFMLRSSAKHSLNVEAAFRHIVADQLGTLGVVVSSLLILAFDWTIADPIMGVLIGLLILASTWRLLAKVVRVLLEAVPEHIDVYQLCSTMEEEAGVTVIHDIHVWSIAPGYDALTAHVLIDPEYEGDPDALLYRLRHIVRDDFGIEHITIQLERSTQDCMEDHHVNHLLARARA